MSEIHHLEIAAAQADRHPWPKSLHARVADLTAIHIEIVIRRCSRSKRCAVYCVECRAQQLCARRRDLGIAQINRARVRFRDLSQVQVRIGFPLRIFNCESDRCQRQIWNPAPNLLN